MNEWSEEVVDEKEEKRERKRKRAKIDDDDAHSNKRVRKKMKKNVQGDPTMMTTYNGRRQRV